MARITLQEQPDFAVFPIDSILLLKIEAIDVQTVEGKRGTWEKLNFEFKILDVQTSGDGSGREGFEATIGSKIWGSVPFKLTDSPENKLRLWVEAVYGMALGVGFELDTDLLLNKQVRGVTSQYHAKALDPKTGEGFKRHQIDSLLPYGQTAGLPTAAPVMPNPWAATAPASVPYDDEPPF